MCPVKAVNSQSESGAGETWLRAEMLRLKKQCSAVLFCFLFTHVWAHTWFLCAGLRHGCRRYLHDWDEDMSDSDVCGSLAACWHRGTPLKKVMGWLRGGRAERQPWPCVDSSRSCKFPPPCVTDRGALFVWPDNWHERRKQLSSQHRREERHYNCTAESTEKGFNYHGNELNVEFQQQFSPFNPFSCDFYILNCSHFEEALKVISTASKTCKRCEEWSIFSLVSTHINGRFNNANFKEGILAEQLALTLHANDCWLHHHLQLKCDSLQFNSLLLIPEEKLQVLYIYIGW